MKRKIKPFSSLWEKFNFCATAAYYLCWYTLNRDVFLAASSYDCYDTYRTKENNLFSYSKQNNTKYRCSEINFCPDVCCARAFFDTKFNHSRVWIDSASMQEICHKHRTNPCAGFKDGSCELSKYENSNLEDLKSNRINVTCACETGFRYTSETRQCSDIDECLELTHDCFRTYRSCLNTIGSFLCVDQTGYPIKHY